MQSTVGSRTQVRHLARSRPWIAVVVAAVIFALTGVLGLQLFFVLQLIGLTLAVGAPADYVADSRTVDRRPRNLVLGILVLIHLAVVVLEPQLTLWLVVLLGLSAAGFCRSPHCGHTAGLIAGNG